MNLARRSMANPIEDVKSEYANTALIIFGERNGKSKRGASRRLLRLQDARR